MVEAEKWEEFHGLSGLASMGTAWMAWSGCSKVDTGCKRCVVYDVLDDPDRVRRGSSDDARLPEVTSDPTLFFVTPLSDFFHPQADAWRDDAWDVIERTPHHTYLLLTRRPELAQARLPRTWPFANVWLGVGVEDQRTAERRLPILLETPAYTRLGVLEPVLGPIDVSPWLAAHTERDALRGHCSCTSCVWSGVEQDPTDFRRGLDWVMAGGEFGRDCRPMEVSWAETIQQVCDHARVPFHFKQWGGYPDDRTGDKATLSGRLRLDMPPGEWPFLRRFVRS